MKHFVTTDPTVLELRETWSKEILLSVYQLVESSEQSSKARNEWSKWQSECAMPWEHEDALMFPTKSNIIIADDLSNMCLPTPSTLPFSYLSYLWTSSVASAWSSTMTPILLYPTTFITRLFLEIIRRLFYGRFLQNLYLLVL